MTARGRPAPGDSASQLVDERRAAQVRGAALATLLLPTFAALDLALAFTLYPAARLSVVLGLRAGAVAATALVWYVAASRRFPARVVSIVSTGSQLAVAAALAGMATQFGGPNSLYLHGVTVIIMVRAGAVAAPLREAMRTGLLIAVTYPLVFAAVMALSPAARAAWLTWPEAERFGAQFLLVCSSVAAGSLASAATFRVRNQLFEARKLGRYRLAAPLGSGGQGEVWLALEEGSRRKVALKVLRAERASTEAVRLFEREARLARQLRSPHTVRVLDHGASDDGVYYLAMEYLVGEDLGVLLREHGPMSASRAVHFALQACRSLEEAHGVGLVHRDVKPGNLFALSVEAEEDHLKLLDFGIARSLDADVAATAHTATGVVRGTPAYMAPEVCLGTAASPAADLYSVGATLYHLLTGTPPFLGGPSEVVARHLHDRPTPPRERRADVPAELEAIVLRCLEKDPARRHPSAAALRADLEACGVAPWTSADGSRFWRHERHAVKERLSADTLPERPAAR